MSANEGVDSSEYRPLDLHPLAVRQRDRTCRYAVRPYSLLVNLIPEQIQGRAMLLRWQCPAADLGNHFLR